MKSIRALAIAAFLFPLAVHAQQTPATVKAEIDAKITSNNRGAITGPILNGILNDIVDLFSFASLSGQIALTQLPIISANSILCNNTASPAITTVCTSLPFSVPAGNLAPGAAAANIGTLGGDLAGTLPNPTIIPNVALSGAPTAPTPTLSDNSTRIATTAFVKGQVSDTVPWFNVLNYAASGSDQVTTGDVNGTSTIVLASALDFANGQGIRINQAGPNPSIGNAVSPGVVYTGAAGTTSYAYRIAAIDGSCGIRTATAPVTANSAAALGSLGYSNYNTISWSPTGPTGRYVIWRSINGGPYNFLTVVAGLSFQDGGYDLGYIPDCIPNNPTASDQAQWLITSIASGGGTTTLTLAGSASQTAVGLSVQHDDTVAINAAIIAAGPKSFVLIPCGTFKITNSIVMQRDDQTLKGLGDCTSIQGYGINDDIVVTGVSLLSLVSNTTVSDFLLRSYGKFGGKTLNARFFYKLLTENISSFNPWDGTEFYNFNTLIMNNWRVNRFWGSNSVGYFIHSGPTGEYACCVYATNLTAVGYSKFGGFSGIMIDKPGFWFDGNIATIQGYSWSSIEIEGKALLVTNNIGNTGLPQFFNITDLETEFTNDRAIDLEAGLNFNFNNSQVHGARENNIFIGAAVSNVNFHGGLVSGAKADGFYVAGTNVTIGNMQVYDNSNPGSGGTAGLAYGIEFAGTARRFATSNVTVGTPATAAQQFCGIAIQAGADHFNVSGVSSADSNVNGGVCDNTGGASSSKIMSVAN